MKISIGILLRTIVVVVALLLSACGGGGGTPTSTTPSFNIGGAVSGLNGSVVLQDNGGDNLTLSTTSSFIFPTAVAYGSPYSVSVLTQPSGQKCTVSNASGTITGNISNLTVNCVFRNQWTWVGGSDPSGQNGVYGTLGVASTSNVPDPRFGEVSWKDNNGTLWLFGGNGLDFNGAGGYLNDVWKFDGSQWTWVSGSNISNQGGVYGTQGVASASNIPSARTSSASWTDSTGTVWLFGGTGYDSNGNGGGLNDLWKFDGSQWTWVSGYNGVNWGGGAYGTLGAADPANVPGQRINPVIWGDNHGSLWLFGGYGDDSNGITGNLNDLWKFDGSQWAWVSGSNIVNQPGVYGTLGVAAASNIPGGRFLSVNWTDSSGTLWLLGGGGYDSAGTNGDLNDLWKFDGSQWTWVSGSKLVNQNGVYGTLGMAAASNMPGARYGSVGWRDNSGTLWLFGGIGHDSAGTTPPVGTAPDLNDLWKFDGSQWTWVSGSNLVNQSGVPGTLGAAAAGNYPGARDSAVTWVDNSGKFWIFGGIGYDSTGSFNYLNDLWSYQP